MHGLIVEGHIYQESVNIARLYKTQTILVKLSGQRFSPSQVPANFATSFIKRQAAWKWTYKCKHCDCLLANGETFDEAHARDVPATVPAPTVAPNSKSVEVATIIPLCNFTNGGRPFKCADTSDDST